MAATTLIGKLGNLLEVRCPRPDLAAPIVRDSSEVVTIGGVRYVQRAPRGLRSWAWDLRWASPADIGNLVALEQGVYGVPPWRWYDPMAAALNLLRPSTAAPATGGDLGWTGSGAALSSLDLNNLIVTGAGEARAPLVPVVAGRTYTASAQLQDSFGGPTTSRLRMHWTDSAGAITSVTDGPFVTSPNRASLTAVAPVGAAGVILALDPTGALPDSLAWGQSFQLTENAAAVTWHPGMGVAGVEFSGLAEAYQATWGGTRRDLSITLREVGG